MHPHLRFQISVSVLPLYAERNALKPCAITSLSVKPIRMIATLGVFIFAVSIGILIYALIRHLGGNTVSGWTSLAISIWALGGIQLLAIGTIGEYIGKIYLETKHRPAFLVEEYLRDGINETENDQ